MTPAPMMDLQRFVADIKPALAERWVRAGQRAGLISWRDDSRGMLARFDRAGQRVYQFSERMPVRGGKSTPKYVHTGSFRDQMRRRKTTRAGSGAVIATKFSIGGGVMNLLSADKQRGFTSVVTATETKIIDVPGYTRATGVQVSGYQQRSTKSTRKYSRSAKTYAEEWTLRDWEILEIKSRCDAAILSRFRKSALNKNGTLKDSVREISRAAAAA